MVIAVVITLFSGSLYPSWTISGKDYVQSSNVGGINPSLSVIPEERVSNAEMMPSSPVTTVGNSLSVISKFFLHTLKIASDLISLNSTSVSKQVSMPQQPKVCENLSQVEVNVNKHVLYEGDQLIIQGSAPSNAQLQGRLIPLDGKTPGKMLDVPLNGSHFEYILHQFGSEDKELKYAVIVDGLKDTNDGTCLLGAYKVVEYKGAR